MVPGVPADSADGVAQREGALSAEVCFVRAKHSLDLFAGIAIYFILFAVLVVG